MDPANQPQVSRAGRLMTARIIWGAMLMGQIMFLAIIVLVIWANARPEQRLDEPEADSPLRGHGDAGVGGPGGLLAAKQNRGAGVRWTHRRWGYFTGNILLWAMMEGASLFGLVMMMLDQKAWPFLGIVIVAMAVQAINFPTGNGMK